MQRSERLNKALLEIATLVVQSMEAHQLYERIHDIIGRIIPAKNLIIISYDADKATLFTDYFVDEKDGRVFEGRTLALGEGLSSYVVKKREPCLLSDKDIRDLVGSGQVKALGTPACSWMGVPVMLADRLLGLIVLQSYDPASVYEPSDVELMVFVAAHIAVVFENQRHLMAERDARRVIEDNITVIQAQKDELQNAIGALRLAQDDLIQTEKMASLGRLVAGVAHEVNTPLGVCLTGITNLAVECKRFEQRCQDGHLTRQHLDNLLDDIRESCQIVETNLRRAAELVRSFKTIAVDQGSDSIRQFDLGDYIGEVVQSLSPMLRRSPFRVHLDVAGRFPVRTRAGALSQVLTNLITNSLIHGFEGRTEGRMHVQVELSGNEVLLTYADDGLGMDEAGLGKLFEPFYTTKRGRGGSGLGAHVVFNLVAQSLKGRIAASSEPGKGLIYRIRFPAQIDA